MLPIPEMIPRMEDCLYFLDCQLEVGLVNSPRGLLMTSKDSNQAVFIRGLCAASSLGSTGLVHHHTRSKKRITTRRDWAPRAQLDHTDKLRAYHGETPTYYSQSITFTRCFSSRFSITGAAGTSHQTAYCQEPACFPVEPPISG